MEKRTNENPILIRRTKKSIKTSSRSVHNSHYYFIHVIGCMLHALWQIIQFSTKNYKDQTASRVDIHSSQLTRLTYSGSQPNGVSWKPVWQGSRIQTISVLCSLLLVKVQWQTLRGAPRKNLIIYIRIQGKNLLYYKSL